MGTELEKSNGVSNPLVLLQAMIEKGTDTEQLGKLMDLCERWNANQALAAFNRDMHEAQAEMPTVVKDAENKNTRSGYARLETVIHAIKPVYTKHGFSLLFEEVDCPKEGHVRIVANVSHKGGYVKPIHGDFALDGVGPNGQATAMNRVQAKGSTIAYARRYLTLMAFNVPVANEDQDGNGENAPITRDHIQAINELLEECELAGNKVDFKRFLAWLGIESLDKLPMKDFLKATNELNRKRKTKKEAAK